MEVIVQKKKESRNVAENEKYYYYYPPLVFVHGSYHAAWCWAEQWLPFFSESGYDCYSLSLLGQVLVFLFLYLYYFYRNNVLCMS
jgi:pimeloyl-ACP methyl ester carboxylesterase